MFGPDNTVLDTFRFEGTEIFLKSYHIQRSFEALSLENSAISLNEITNLYDRIEKTFAAQSSGQQILRLFLNFENHLSHQVEFVQKSFFASDPKVQIMTECRAPSGLGKQNYKWKNRAFWEQALQKKSAEIDDLIFLNTEDELTESSRYNLFFYDAKEDLVWTPALDSGCINGVYRRYVMNKKSIQLPDHKNEKKVLEKKMHPFDIHEMQIYLANSVRGVLKAQLWTS